MNTLSFRRCENVPNLHCHSSRKLYVLAYVDDLMIVGEPQRAKGFVEALNKELLVKVTAELRSGTDASFLGRRLHHNGDSIDMFMPKTFIDEFLALYNMKDSH